MSHQKVTCQPCARLGVPDKPYYLEFLAYRHTRLSARRKDSPLIAPMIPVGEDGQV